jgi:UDP-glucose 4-epimerase
MSVLITGGMGFIGLHTARSFVEAGEDCVITYYQTWREPSFIKDEYGKHVTVEQADVSDPQVVKQLAAKHKVDSILHLAVPGVAALSAAEDYRVNMDGLIGVLEAARELEVRRLTIASSVAVYASLGDGPLREDALLPVTSGNPTETFKKAWEVLGTHYADRTKLDVVFLRIAGIWGPLYHSMMNLPSRLAHGAVKGTEPDFSPGKGGVPFAEDAQDLCYVKDTAEGIRIVHQAPTLEHRVYNIGQGAATSVGQLVDAVRKVKPGAQIEVNPGKGPRNKQNNYMDISRAAALGYKPAFTPEAAMADYIGWLDAGNER